jgi:hypothetical protein
MSGKIEISRELAERWTKMAEVFDDGGDGADPETARTLAQEIRALLAAPVVERQEPAAWANDQQLLLCRKSPREDQPNNPMLHNLPRNIASSARKTDYCNTPLYTSAPVSTVWSYCPECGSEDLQHEKGEHKQCANCHQEWFSDIDYSEVVRVNLARLKAARVVLPERKTVPRSDFEPFEAAEAKGWNACLDDAIEASKQ